jgi:hypothetical protein
LMICGKSQLATAGLLDGLKILGKCIEPVHLYWGLYLLVHEFRPGRH